MAVSLLLQIMQAEGGAFVEPQLGWWVRPTQHQVSHDLLVRHRTGEKFVLLFIRIDCNPLLTLGLQKAGTIDPQFLVDLFVAMEPTCVL